MAVSRYVTLSKITHHGVDFPAGTPVALSDGYAAPLLAIGAIQAQAGTLPAMPTVPGDVVRETVDTGSGGKARTYVEAISSATGLERLGERGAALLSPSIQIQSGLVGRRWAFLGESHTDGTGAGNFAYSYMYEALTMVGGLIARPDSIEAGVPGERTDQILARLPAVISAGAQALVIQMGSNDANQAVPLASTIANVTEMVRTARSYGMPVVLCTVPPRASTASAAIRQAVASINLWVRSFARSMGAELADINRVLADPATGHLLASLDFGDGIHFNATGHTRVAQVVAAAMVRASGMASSYGLVTSPDAYNLITDPLNQRASATGGGWFEQPGGSGTAPTYSFQADTSGFLPAGRWAEQDFDAVAGGTRYLATAINTAGWAVGDEIAVTAHLQIADVSGTWEADVVAGTADCKVVVTNQSGSIQSVAGLMQRNVGLPAASGLYNVGPIVIPFVVPAGVTALNLWMMGKLPTGKRCKFRIGCIGAFNLTQMGLGGAFGSGIAPVAVG